MKAENQHGNHELFEKLCILSTTGELNETEAWELSQHAKSCESCRRELSANQEFVNAGMAYLASQFAKQDGEEQTQLAEMGRAKHQLLRRLKGMDAASKTRIPLWRMPKPVWITLATAVLTSTGLLLAFAYRAGERNSGSKAATVVIENRELRERLNSLVSQESAIDHQLEAQGKTIAELSARAQQQADELAKWREVANTRQTQNDSLVAASRQQTTTVESLSAERDTLEKKLEDSEKALRLSETQLASARAERQRDLVRLTSLEADMRAVSARLKDQDTTVAEQQNFLASDRDIRELMGARDLYIADVFDVDGNGTNKPFGRVFYTKNKSLVFYAFDLGQQPHVQNASIFQAWGRRGVTDKTPLNLGIFYLDNEANKRWVLKFDDPDKLAQVDAVFVTVEPHGGSKKPSGKQLLFASIKGIANHP